MTNDIMTMGRSSRKKRRDNMKDLEGTDKGKLLYLGDYVRRAEGVYLPVFLRFNVF